MASLNYSSSYYGLGASIGGFAGCGGNIVGGEYGVGLGIPGASLLAGPSYTYVHSFGGITALLAQGVFGLVAMASSGLTVGGWLSRKLAQFIFAHVPRSWIPGS